RSVSGARVRSLERGAKPDAGDANGLALGRSPPADPCPAAVRTRSKLQGGAVRQYRTDRVAVAHANQAGNNLLEGRRRQLPPDGPLPPCPRVWRTRRALGLDRLRRPRSVVGSRRLI